MNAWLAGARASYGAVQLLRPAYSAEQLLGGPLDPGAVAAVRVLGARQFAQAAVSVAAPSARLLALGVGADGAHALSMAVLALADHRRRRRGRAAGRQPPGSVRSTGCDLLNGGAAMQARKLLPGRSQPPVHGIDRMVRNVQTGRFERGLSALTAAGALVTAAEIYFEHDSASFGNKMMWVPVVLGPVGAAAGLAGFFSRRMAKTALPIASAAIVANGLQGTYLHARGIAQKPGGWSNARYNMEMGPPLLAPLLVTMVGGMGLLAAVLRREK